MGSTTDKDPSTTTDKGGAPSADDENKAFPRKDRRWFKEGDQGREPDSSAFAPEPAPQIQGTQLDGSDAEPDPTIWQGGPGPNEHEPGLGLVTPYINSGSGFGRK